jgi:hypothetical protein
MADARINRSTQAFAIAPLGAIAVYGSLLLVDPFEGSIGASLDVLAFVAAAAYVTEAVALLPFLFLKRRLDQIGLGSYLVGGFLMGTLTAIALNRGLNLFRWKYYAACAAAGTASAAVFSIVLTWRKRPSLGLG